MPGAVTPKEGSSEDDKRFLCDEMLGKLAKWMRLLGYDTSYIKTKDDGVLVIIAEKEGRILLTRDKQLSTRSKGAIYIISDDPDVQLIQVFKELELKKDRALSLCSVCGKPIEQVPKEGVKGEVPPKVFELQDEFWYCGRCHKYYWKGTHFEKILKRIDEL